MSCIYTSIHFVLIFSDKRRLSLIQYTFYLALSVQQPLTL